ncbi:MAG: hypothetical protein IJ193_02295 [Bacilli bacterium]|nr:hypothetical protein [Bacilli bacterium]
MAFINSDIDKLRECGNHIIQYSNDYLEVMNELMKKMENVSNNNVWHGESANKFIENIKKDKVQYTAMGNSLKSFGQTIVNFSNDLSGVK